MKAIWNPTHGDILKNKRGITLIALVVTIIVLLILSGVSINLIFENNSLFRKAHTSAEVYKKQAAFEQMQIKVSEIEIKYQSEMQRFATLQEIADSLSNDEEIEYVNLGKPIGSINVSGYSSIITKLIEYEYLFEVTDNGKVYFFENDNINILIDSHNYFISNSNNTAKITGSISTNTNSSVEVYALKDGEKTSNITADENGKFVYEVNSEGVYTIKVKDEYGREKETDRIIVEQDLINPAINNVDAVYDFINKKVSVNANVTDEGSGIHKVQYSLLAGATASQEYTLNNTFEGINPGTYTIAVVAEDNVGNKSEVKLFNYYIKEITSILSTDSSMTIYTNNESNTEYSYVLKDINNNVISNGNIDNNKVKITTNSRNL